MKRVLLFFCFIFTLSTFSAFATEHLDGKTIRKIDIFLMQEKKDFSSDTKTILPLIESNENDAFSQITFDKDLKTLSEDFDRVDSNVSIDNDQIIITIKLWPKPFIRTITWEGNHYFKTNKLQKELDIKPNSIFIRQDFIKSLNNVKDLYLKKGFFESEITFSLEKVSDEVIIHIHVKEGKMGHVAGFIWKGFTKEEEKTLRSTIFTRRYNFLVSWMTGSGIFREDALEQDQMTVLSYLQNKGYADASVDVNILESTLNNQILIEFNAHRGTLYRFGEINIEGHDLIGNDEIIKLLPIHNEEIFSPEKVRETAQFIRDYYGQRGYIDSDITYDIHLAENEPIYKVSFHVDKGDCFSVGMVKIYGNDQTQSNVILRESLLVPGEVFDSRRLKATQERLQNIGYFKNVNIFAVHTPETLELPQTEPKQKRDVHIEVEETTTGNISVMMGISSLEHITGGLELTERNFNHRGIFTMFSNHPTGLKGGGEYVHASVNLGSKQRNYLVSWLNPYLMDSLWRVGFEASLTQSELISSDYKTRTYGFSLSASYPITNYWTYGSKYRLRNERTNINDDAGAEAVEQGDNRGLVSGLDTYISYDSTDSAYKARRGLRSSLDAEFVGLGGDYTFFKFGYLNNYYLPLWPKGTMKFRADFKFIEPVGRTTTDDIPISERFFLGGENTVRGYKPYILGPRFDKRNDPTGGISSTLLSIECSQELHKLIDIFAFVDAGSISLKHFDIQKLNASYGVGTRLQIMSRVPIMVGIGFPINPDYHSDRQTIFFSMGGQF